MQVNKKAKTFICKKFMFSRFDCIICGGTFKFERAWQPRYPIKKTCICKHCAILIHQAERLFIEKKILMFGEPTYPIYANGEKMPIPNPPCYPPIKPKSRVMKETNIRS